MCVILHAKIVYVQYSCLVINTYRNLRDFDVVVKRMASRQHHSRLVRIIYFLRTRTYSKFFSKCILFHRKRMLQLCFIEHDSDTAYILLTTLDFFAPFATSQR